ncbi:RidA family protein [Zavarzinia compransoris]|uniref:Reactive intermediate/imine deaminase n=1 Tax=Zavarzinia compransoris TaxID=1264899 RepID=A0A317E0A6_9PROT|nr:RidA family protein [Zavarzinia compransoris]PWR20072.1 reactive intermediate/imine deaminase [Zavarzinia compransoris]TDP44805.1 2-iminobutanoate/2-iminopropanoate deaminase [Zavarzinia compransoris]
MTGRRHLFLPELATADAPYAHAVAEGDMVHLAGFIAQDDPAWAGRHGTIEEETAAALDLMARALAAAGFGLGDLVRVGVFMTDLGDFARMNAVYARYFPAGRQPARTCVSVAALLGGAKIEIDGIARRRAP